MSAVLAVLALSVGALAYPAVVNSHVLPQFGSTTTSPTVSHPTAGDDNGTTNHTDNETAPASPPPQVNETENETGNASEMTNVTETHMDNTTWVNGTIMVTVDNQTVVDVTFSVVAIDGMDANVTFNGTFTANGTTETVSGTAFLVLDLHVAYIHATYTTMRAGVTLDSRDLSFMLSWDETGHVSTAPVAGMSFGLSLTHY